MTDQMQHDELWAFGVDSGNSDSGWSSGATTPHSYLQPQARSARPAGASPRPPEGLQPGGSLGAVLEGLTPPPALWNKIADQLREEGVLED